MGRRKFSKKQLGIVVTDRWASKNRVEGKRWQIRVWDRYQKRYVTKSFDDEREGRTWADQTQSEIGLHMRRAARTDFKEIGKEYVEHLKLRESAERHVQQTERMIAHFVKMGVRELMDDDVAFRAESVLSSLKKQRGGEGPATPAMKNRYLKCLKAVGSYAHKRRYIPYDPFSCLAGYRQPKHQKEFYTVADLRKLLDKKNADHDLYAYVAFLIYTGTRGSEAKSITWDMINWKASTLSVPADIEGNKLKRPYVLYLQPELLGILKQKAQLNKSSIVPSRYIHANRNDYLMRAVRKFIAACGVEPRKSFRHAFRNTCASLLTAVGVPFYEILQLLNHQDVRVSSEYASLSLHFRNDVENWPKDKSFWLIRDMGKKWAHTEDVVSGHL